MTTRRSAKSKGNSFEYDCQYSLSKEYLDITRTSERGFQRQFDLISESRNTAFECKRCAGFTWNELIKYFKKLEKVSPADYDIYLLFKGNNQPCLIMYRNVIGYSVVTFEDWFKIPFEKHKSTRPKKKKDETTRTINNKINS